jgi:hypothetical protein
MMRRVFSGLLSLCVLVVLVVFAGGAGGAQTNTQDGENNSDSHQSGRANAGNAITGQVVGVASSGGASVDATNHTDNSNATTGDATARNHAKTFAGQNISEIHAPGSTKSPVVLTNKQTGDNRTSVSQSASASTGDGIAGQVIGVVTTNGPSSIAASNSTTNSDVTTGDATASNSANAFTGLNISGVSNFDSSTGCFIGCVESPTAIATLTVTNSQTGDNRTRARQSSHASSGDGIVGQVIGAVTAGGSSSIDATNRSENSTVNTGDADASNSATLFTGLNVNELTNTSTAVGCIFLCLVEPTALAVATATNTQVGDNSGRASQHASATTGDGVAGQVIGAFTSGGSSSIVASNTSRDVDVFTGNGTASNGLTAFVGLNISDVTNTAAAVGCFIACIDTGTALATLTVTNDQTGDNGNRSSQTARANSGDGVAGQVIGAVTSGGSSRIDARNVSDDVFVNTGDADATNSVHAFVGENLSDPDNAAFVGGCFAGCLVVATATAVLNATNSQTGDNRNRASQAASASSGDGVAGQVIGASTSGGSSEIFASNTSRDVDVFTGNATASNHVTAFVGLNIDHASNTAAVFGCVFLCAVLAAPTAVLTATNNQTGDNRGSTSQAAHASTGDGVAGQVIGAVTSGGNSRIDAKNRSENVDVVTGDASATNSTDIFVGLHLSDLVNTATVTCGPPCAIFGPAPVIVTTPANVQTGTNTNSTSQSAAASSGDGVGGQVVGAVASGGATTVTLSNTTTGVNVESGGSTENNSDNAFVGLSFSPLSII